MWTPSPTQRSFADAALRQGRVTGARRCRTLMPLRPKGTAETAIRAGLVLPACQPASEAAALDFSNVPAAMTGGASHVTRLQKLEENFGSMKGAISRHCGKDA
jgi:hypothetical protein